MPRIEPLHPPYEPEVGRRLAAMVPPGVEPLALFRTFARNLPMADAMHGWGTYELGRTLSLDRRLRELAIVRTCARCRCEYEWGVHVAWFGPKVGLDPAQVRSLTVGHPDDPCWDEPVERAVLRAVDQLHDTATVDDEAWRDLAHHLDEAQLLDLLALCGWYHAIAFTANAAEVGPEPGAPRFGDVGGDGDGGPGGRAGSPP